MQITDQAPLRVLVPLVAVLLVGIVAAAVQEGGDGPGESVVQATPTASTTLRPPPTRPAQVSPRPTRPAVTTAPAAPQVTTAPAATTAPAVPTSAPPTTSRPTPTTTPSSTPFLPGPPTSGTTALDGVRVEVQVDRSQARAGDTVTVTTTVTNTRPTPVVYRATCPSRVQVKAATGANAQPSIAWSGDKQTFKDLALAGLVGAGNAFTPVSPATCPSGAPVLTDLAAGRTIREQFTWKAATAYRSAYDGQAPVTASFSFALDRGGLGAGQPEFSTVESSAPLRLVGEGSGIVPPTVAVDAALSIQQFAAFVEEGDSAVWEPPYAPGSTLGATVVFTPDTRSTYTVKLTRPDASALVRVLADTGTPISITVT